MKIRNIQFFSDIEDEDIFDTNIDVCNVRGWTLLYCSCSNLKKSVKANE
jgi:hypothetical protein